MKRRQFGAMLATATISLGGTSSVAAETSAQGTDPLKIEDVSVDLGGVTASIGRVSFTFQDGTMRFQLDDWSMESAAKSLSIGRTRVTVSEVDAKTFAALRAAMVESFRSRSVVPLVVGLVETDINPEAPVRLVVGPVETDGQLVADKITATGVLRSIVPAGTRDALRSGPTLAELTALGSSEWTRLRVQRGDAQFTANDVTMQLQGGTLAVASPAGSASVSDRSFEFTDMALTLRPPETIPEAHLEFASRVRQLAAEGSPSPGSVRSAAVESGVTVSNTTEAARSARFNLSFGEVTENGETAVADFEVSGTLAELVQILQQRV